MNAARNAAPRRADRSRPGLRRAPSLLRLALPTCAALALLAGCADHPPSTDGNGDAASTVHKLGAVPIPSRPAGQATPTADEHHLQLVAMGAPIRAQLPGVTALVVASGPVEDLPSAGGKVPDQTKGTITITVSQATAPLTVKADDFSSRDEQGKDVALSPAGPTTVTATTGKSANLVLSGTYHSGAAQLTWRHDGKVVAIWDFNIELD
ncbi:hypothetical protein ACFOSC_24735 [Streptantibioticus rubrisoli]|uniref:Lipoprotein n=1 Tax=Streptantibioticus rubrisoli TaxID=1387313 RepID=A0ABT1PB99_9ACTN|nr:hypothetical protein [Streptantibioticus rubrisoli]MCQ4042621.1 hypothetical protein [Streptantibioticus rubrisoli]